LTATSVGCATAGRRDFRSRAPEDYRVHKREPGFVASVASLFHRKYDDVRAVDGIDFEIEPGERVGFLGPNGAGKTTTLKMLAGLLHPTAGEARVDGHEPSGGTKRS